MNPMLTQGDAFPSFSLETDTLGPVTNASFHGRFLVLYFYPKDNTPGCTREAQAFSAHAEAFHRLGAEVLGVSKDSLDSHREFRVSCALGIPLASDPDLLLHKACGAYGEKTLYGKTSLGVIRSTFVIDPEGKVAHVFPNVKVDGHAEKVLAMLQTLMAQKG